MRKIIVVWAMGMMCAATAQISFASGGDKKQIDTAAEEASLAQGRAFMQQRDYAKAISAFEKADKISHHTCASCLLELFEAQRRAGYVMDALDTANKAVKEAGDDKALAAKAHLVRGVLLGEMATKPSDKKNEQAADEMRQAIALDPTSTIELYDLGYELMKQGKDADGIAELKTYVASAKAEPRLIEKAKAMIGDPQRAREPFAPDFSFTSLEGQGVSLTSLRGKVGLLDFWGTWCPPCRESIPTMVRLHKEFASQPVEILGISSDTDEQAWRAFIAKNQMTWPEYLDTSGAMQNTFGIDSFPTYILLDRDGVIRFRQSGFGDETGMLIEDAIKKALKEKPEAGASIAATTVSKASPTQGNGETNAGPANDSPAGTQGVRPSMVVTPAGATASPSQGTSIAGPTGMLQTQPRFALSVQMISRTGSMEVARYVQQMMGKVTRNWIPVMPAAALTGTKAIVVVKVAISRNGSLAGQPEVQQPDTNAQAFDSAALSAITASAPFDALPDAFTGEQLELRVIFLYNEPIGTALPQMRSQIP